ncbi:hypothetical protein HYH02_010188 [Chlamydomonas schloesseri]|uniref:GED domain-containing protein n=1 Tax=Chlamydomonas schloesseri TaxID=2026947 RepID=A0A835W7Y5_9CHLO|nr:hypothetical protein HYH02_010188 [Chlamydomonas schloesseri]|eukprot:KAG2440609.1 hypothetical protein HYH02_010188 [Chlamydomonas schloesseri]
MTVPEDLGPLAATSYHRVSASVLGIANKLRALGVDSALQVPTLVIAGDQSSGKSSVVEAITAVSLPRADGTCTRCPTEVRMRTHAATASLAGGSELAADDERQAPGVKGENGAAAAATDHGSGRSGARRAAPHQWQCSIKLACDYDSEDKPLAVKPPEQLFCVVTDRAHITACVSAAQAVLLNPGAVKAAMGGPQAFVPDLNNAMPGVRPADSPAMQQLGESAGYELAFTSNKVVLEIDGADADLTIIDLPGIIHDHPKGPRFVELVKDMTKAALAPAHHIIAMALTAGQDAETQLIRLLAREVDPEGHRSIGIITKPDTVAEDAHIVYSKLVKLVTAGGELGAAAPKGGKRTAAQLAGQATTHDQQSANAPVTAAEGTQHQRQQQHLRLGYYVVKNPSQEQLAEGISFEEARAAEARYFAAHKHWRPAMGTAPGLAQRLGAKALRDGLSALLVERIEEQLPAMRKAAREQLERFRSEWEAMPPAVVDHHHELFQLLWRVADTLDAAVTGRSSGGGAGGCGVAATHVHNGGDGDRSVYQRLAGVYRSYGQRTIRSTPAFLVGTTLISALSKSEKNISPLLDEGTGCEDEGELDLAALPSNSQSKSGTPIRSAEEAADALANPDNEALQDLLQSQLLPSRPMTIAELVQLRQRHLGRELPGFSPYSAMEELLQRFKGQWRQHAEACLGEVEAAVRELAGRTVAEQLRRFPKAERAVEAALTSHIDRMVDATAGQIEELLGMEDGDVFTLNEHYLRDSQAAFLARLKRAYLRPQKLSAEGKGQVQGLLSELATYGIQFRSYESAFLAQPTPVDDELHMAASCLAYFKVAFKRIQDEVPMAIRRSLLRRLGDRKALEAALRAELPGPDVAAAAPVLLQEDAAVSERRRHCTDMMKRLREALAVLHSPAAQL